jgi:hypothetical protein
MIDDDDEKREVRGSDWEVAEKSDATSTRAVSDQGSLLTLHSDRTRNKTNVIELPLLPSLEEAKVKNATR